MKQLVNYETITNKNPQILQQQIVITLINQKQLGGYTKCKINSKLHIIQNKMFKK